MLEVHRELDERYRTLSESRNGPVYFIEHGFSKKETDRLIDDVRNSLNTHPIESRWWNTNYLPLLVAATEVGYRYRGTGTDFWPVIEDRFGVTVDVNDRHRIREYFREASSIYRGAQPPDTPWARAFHIIAWPITHALLPIEFHRPLALMFTNLRVNVSELNDDELHRAIRIVSFSCSPRFSTVIADVALVVAVTRKLLGGHSNELSSEVVKRIAEDIASDHVTRRAVSVARRIQRGSESVPFLPFPPSPGARLPSLTGSLYLHRRNGAMTLQAVFLPMEVDLYIKLQQALRRRRYVVRLWGVSTPVPSVQLLSSLPFTLNLTEIPPEGAELLSGLDQIDIEPKFREILAAFKLDVMPPLLFSISSDGTRGRQIRGSVISGYRKYWLLSEAGEYPRGCVDMGEVGPYRCYQLDPEEKAARESLRNLGFQVRYGISVGFVGSPPLEREAPVPVFVIGDQRIVVPRRAPPEGLNVHLGDENVHLKDDDVATIGVPAGEHTLCVSNGDMKRDYPFLGMPSPRVLSHVACSIEPRSVDPTVQALLRGALYFDIESLVPLEGLNLTAEIEASGQRISVTVPLEPLPCSIASNREPFVTLLDEKTRDLLVKAKSPTLRLRVGNLCSYYLELEQRIRPCWWEHEDGKYALTSETGALPFGWIPAISPAAPPVPDPKIFPDEARLLTPIDPDVSTHGDAVQFTTLCIAPPHVRLEAPVIEKPRLTRRLRAEPGALGFEDMVVGYLRWSLAETSDFIAEMRRRQITQEMDNWVTTICCGETWVHRESLIGNIDPWEELFRVVRDTGFGRDSYITISDEDNIEVSYIAVRQIRSKMPDLWIRVGSTGNLGPEDYDMLDLACGHAYVVLGARYRKQGKGDIAAEIEGGDPGEAPDEWDAVLERIQSTAELHPLAEMLIPSDMADGLRTLEPSIMSLYELTEELEAWVGRARRTLVGNVPSTEILKAILALWIEVEIAVSLDWRRALDLLLIERPVARAARYLALRSRRAVRRGEHQ